MNIEQLTSLLRQSWSKETCYEKCRDDRYPGNPSVGQCFVTALVVNDYLGWVIVKWMASNGVSHYWNRIDWKDTDLTRDQFDDSVTIVEVWEVEREEIQQNERYKELRRKVEKLVDINSLEGNNEYRFYL